MFSSVNPSFRPDSPLAVEQAEGDPQSDVAGQFAALLDKTIDTSDGDAHKLELRRVIEHAFLHGGTLDLSSTGHALLDLAPDVMAFLEKLGDHPVSHVILPPDLAAVPLCIYELRRLSTLEMSSPKGPAFDFRPLHDLAVIQLTSVPTQESLQLHLPAQCQLIATWPDGQPVSGRRLDESQEHMVFFTDRRDARWALDRLSTLLQATVGTSGGDPQVKALCGALWQAAQYGGTLDLSKVGDALSSLSEDMVLLVEIASTELRQPLQRLILPPHLERLPPGLAHLKHVLHVEADRIRGGDFDFSGLRALQRLELTNVPWFARAHVLVSENCKVKASTPNDQPIKLEKGNVEQGRRLHTMLPRAENHNHIASFPNGQEIECRHLALNVLVSWGIQDSLPPAGRSMHKPLWRVSTPERIALTTPWELNAIHKELGQRPVQSYYVRHSRWPEFLLMLMKDMDTQTHSTKYMLLNSLRHSTCVRLVAGPEQGVATIEHFDPNFTTTTKQLTTPCDFISMFADAPYFEVIYADSASDLEGKMSSSVAEFVRVTIIPDPLDLRSGVARKDKHISISFEFADLDETMSPAFVADLCRDGHSFFLAQVAEYIKASALTRAECMDLLRAQVFVNKPLIYREAGKGDAAIVRGVGACIEAAFVKGILRPQDVVELLASDSAAGDGTLCIAVEHGHASVVKAFGEVLGSLFKAKALNSSQIKRLMLGGGAGNSLPGLTVEEPAVKSAYKAALRSLVQIGALSKEDEKDVRDRVFED